MKGMFGFLSRGFACLAVALVILFVLAVPTQGVRANDPPSSGGTSGSSSCGTDVYCPYCSGSIPTCSQWACLGDDIECGEEPCCTTLGGGCGC